MRTLSLTFAAGLFVAAFVGAAVGTSEGDCGSGADAGGSFATALPVAAPVQCAFTLGTGDDDFFSFHLEAGEVASFVLFASDGLRIYEPSGALFDDAREPGQRVSALSSPDGGTWYLHFLAGTGTRERAFGLYLGARTFEGRVPVGGALTHTIEADGLDRFDGVNGALGPGEAPVIDGQWFDLPATTTGIEWIFGRDGDANIWFYDEDGAWIENHACDRIGVFSACQPPAGAARILVTDQSFGVSSPVDEFRFKLDYHW